MNVMWLTDPHLRSTYKDPAALDVVLEMLREQAQAKAVAEIWVTGDISTGQTLATDLDRLAMFFGVPVRFVLGNHDFWGVEVQNQHVNVTKLCAVTSNLIWQHGSNAKEIKPGVWVVGCDGWADGYYANFPPEPLTRDFVQIQDFAQVDYEDAQHLCRSLAEISAIRLQEQIAQIPPEATSAWVLTHVPPFVEIGPEEPELVPFYTCKTVGDGIIKAAQQRPEVQWNVLSGHVHLEQQADILPNLTVRSGPAKYSTIQSTILHI